MTRRGVPHRDDPQRQEQRWRRQGDVRRRKGPEAPYRRYGDQRRRRSLPCANWRSSVTTSAGPSCRRADASRARGPTPRRRSATLFRVFRGWPASSPSTVVRRPAIVMKSMQTIAREFDGIGPLINNLIKATRRPRTDADGRCAGGHGGGTGPHECPDDGLAENWNVLTGIGQRGQRHHRHHGRADSRGPDASPPRCRKRWSPCRVSSTVTALPLARAGRGRADDAPRRGRLPQLGRSARNRAGDHPGLPRQLRPEDPGTSDQLQAAADPDSGEESQTDLCERQSGQPGPMPCGGPERDGDRRPARRHAVHGSGRP